jgi:SAM-dependent methyltransferase
VRPLLARLRAVHNRLYESLCGRPPVDVRPLHRQWLVYVDLHRDLRELLPGLDGRVLDVGCGEQPYRPWLPSGGDYVGIDVDERPGTVRISPGERWPLDDASFDAVLCTQVLEHDSDPDHTLAEIERVLRPGGRAVISVPFAYNEHAMPHDYRRWSAVGARALAERRLDVQEVRKQGLAGSLVGTLWLNWLEHQIGGSAALQLLRALLMPFWILYCGVVNAIARAIDGLDRTGAFYLNVLVVARKR